jgi:hypothetical protein
VIAARLAEYLLRRHFRAVDYVRGIGVDIHRKKKVRDTEGICCPEPVNAISLAWLNVVLLPGQF